MYGFKRTCKINDVIKSMFEEKSKPTISSLPLENTKSMDPTMFPPCKLFFEEQTKRAWFIAHIYKTVVETYPAINHTTIDFGLEIDENHEYLLQNMLVIKKSSMKFFLLSLNKQYRKLLLKSIYSRSLFLDLFELAEKPKWKWMAEDIYMRKLLKYFNAFPRTKSYFLTQFVNSICFLLNLNK